MSKQSPRRAVGYYYVRYFIGFLVEVLIFSGLVFLYHHFKWSPWVLNILIILLAMSFLYKIIYPWILWKYRFYSLQEQYLSNETRFFFQKQQVLKYNRIQFVERESGPILLGFKLYKLSIVTAGHVVTLPLLTEGDAVTIESVCMRQLEEVDADV
ncbi:PH domain-containing protein [Staphylococcus simulans]|uniref:PH domain-containing protein n=1 Tax=Staphylococcus simulans TaxID=1286 RepID=UPI00399B960C